MDENENKGNNTPVTETFDTWTIVVENPSNQNNLNIDDNETKRVEVLNKDDHLSTPEINVEELSDGISVISETESIEEYSERISHLQEPLFRNESQFKETETALNPKIGIDRNLTYAEKHELQNQISSDSENYLTVKNVVSGIFYIGVIAGLLGFLGQLKNINDGTSLLDISDLKQRVDSLELHNNLLRAEIDILQKQATYLINQQQSNNQFNKNYKSQKHQNQEDSKLNDNPDNNKYEEEKFNYKRKPDIVSACEENEQYLNGICTIIDNKKEKNDNMQQSFEDKNSKNKENQNYNDMNGKHEQNDHIPRLKPENYKQYEHKNSGKNVDNFSAESNENEMNKNDDLYKKPKKYNENKNDRYNSKERKYNKSKDNNKYNDNSKEYNKYDKSKENNKYKSKETNKYDNSKEYNKNDNSKEYNKNDKFKESNKFDRKKNDNDWHIKRMDSREEYRKQNAQGKDNNWYVERGHSREESRMFQDDEYKRKTH